MVGLEVDLILSPLDGVQRFERHLTVLIFAVIAVVGQNDARVINLQLLLEHAVMNPEVVDSRAPAVVVVSA